MAEYIKREALYEKAYWHGKTPDFDNPYPDGVEAVDVADIDTIPAADVVEAKRGRWEEADDGDGVVCSVCREDFCNIYLEVDRFNFCPNCGADMREAQL
jgi:hypothetical protein